MAPRKTVGELPDEKRADAGEAHTPEVRQRAAPGKIRLKARDYFKDGMILGPHTGLKPEVRPDEVIEVTPGTAKQLKEAAPQNWIVL